MDTPQHKSFKVLVLGDACIDRYHYGYCDRLSPEAPVPILRHNHSDDREGMSLNVANNLRAFGVQVDKVNNPEPISKERFVDLKTRQHLIRFDKGEVTSLEPYSIAAAKNLDLRGYDAVVISDYNKGFITFENATILAARCATRNIPLFVDSKKGDLSCYSSAILKINEKEFKRATKYPIDYELVVTMGSSGARWGEKHYSTEECEVFDVSGAGDTFLAALVYEYLKTSSLDKAIQFANKCSRLVVQRFGTYSITKEDVESI